MDETHNASKPTGTLRLNHGATAKGIDWNKLYVLRSMGVIGSSSVIGLDELLGFPGARGSDAFGL